MPFSYAVDLNPNLISELRVSAKGIKIVNVPNQSLCSWGIVLYKVKTCAFCSSTREACLVSIPPAKVTDNSFSDKGVCPLNVIKRSKGTRFKLFTKTPPTLTPASKIFREVPKEA